MLRVLALSLLLPFLTSCFSVGVRVHESVVVTEHSDTAIVLRSRETMPVLMGPVGILPPFCIIDVISDLWLPWYALASDELDVRWGPFGALLAQLPGVTIIPTFWIPPSRWWPVPMVWPQDEFAELLAAARAAEQHPEHLLELWRRGNRDPTVRILDVRLLEVRSATVAEKEAATRHVRAQARDQP